MIRGNRTRKRFASGGFTLVEALISIVLLAVGVAVVSGLYTTGMKALAIQHEEALYNSAMRSRMEFLLSLEVDQLADGSETVSIQGTDYTLDWTISDVDIDGDTFVDTGVKEISVALDGETLTALVVDSSGQVAKH
jgi:type II secretory pathway pseudopilin PulG